MWFVPPPLDNPLKDKQEDGEDGVGGGNLIMEWESLPDPDNVAQRPSVRTGGAGPWTCDTGDKDGTVYQTNLSQRLQGQS